MVGEAIHPYMANWFPVGHIVDTVIHLSMSITDYFTAIKNGEGVTPNFRDGLMVQKYWMQQSNQQSKESGRKSSIKNRS